MKKYCIKCVMVFLTVLIASMSVAIAEETRVNKAPTFVRGFAAGLRPTPSDCNLDLLVSFTAQDFAREAQEQCGRSNPRNKYCIRYCIEKATRERQSARTVFLNKVAHAPCLKPERKRYSTQEDCLKARLRHCSVNCINKGREQSRCSRDALNECKRISVTKKR